MEPQRTIDRIRAVVAVGERAIPWVALAAATTGLFVLVRSQRNAVGTLDWRIPWETAATSALAFALAPLIQGASFWLVLRMLTGRTAFSEAMLVWARAYLIRYAPGGQL